MSKKGLLFEKVSRERVKLIFFYCGKEYIT